MSRYQLAQLNIAKGRGTINEPVMADFKAHIERINALAEAAPGFVWRLKDEGGDATALRPFGPEYYVNLSVWENIDALHHFAFRSAHIDILRRRREWFERMDEAYAVLWWIPGGHVPAVEEAAERLAQFRKRGPTQEAFSFQTAFPHPGKDASPRAQAQW